MMTFRTITEYIGREAFQPFRIKMASGESFDIPHPEMISANRTTARISVWHEDADGQTAVRHVEVSIILIESIELMTAAAQHDHHQN